MSHRPLPFSEPIYVTRPSLPNVEKFIQGVREIFDSRWLTNNGPVVQRFEQQLQRYLGVAGVAVFANGTLALELALQASGVTGEVITTPFTFVATSHAIVACGATPVFVDVEPDFYTLDAERVEAAITPRTTAILAVHVYGHPCRLRPLAEIAKRHRLKLIYDAAHAFGVRVGGDGIGAYGDVSVFSFHATKLFHTMEGGAATFGKADAGERLALMRNFGIANETEVPVYGTNAKMNEMQALMGTLVLSQIDAWIEERREISALYRELLADTPGIEFPPTLPETVDYNHAYMPVEIHADAFGLSRDELHEELKAYNVFTRRYFYPLVPDMQCYRAFSLIDPLPVARGVADRVLCLPIYNGLSHDDVERICEAILFLAGQARTEGSTACGVKNGISVTR